MGMCTHVQERPRLGYVTEGTVGPAMTWFLICNQFIANLFFDLYLSGTSWRTIYETDRPEILFCSWEKENEYLVYWAKG